MTFMSLDDRSADRKTHTHAIGLGGEERIEQLFRIPGVNAGPDILHRDDDLIGFVEPRPDRKCRWPVSDVRHGFDRVHDQIDDDLL